MRVAGFMVPKEKVAVVAPGASIKDALKALMEMHIGAVVVVNEGKAVGLISKTDFCQAYINGVSVEDEVDKIMSTGLQTVNEDMSRDNAAIFFEKKKIHHAIVTKGDDFVGLISSWDVTAECARDLYAWPWNRTEDGR